MGGCVGRCFPHARREPLNRPYSAGDDDFNFLVEETDSSTTDYKRSSFMSRILSKKKSRAKKHKPVLELVEDLLHSSPGSTYSRLTKTSKRPAYNPSAVNRSDIPLQCLDVRALLQRAGGTASSTPVSSLDLEWEHEALPVSIQDPSISSWAMLPEDTLPDLPSEGSTTAQADASMSDWSRVSSADSLEWDPAQSPLHGSPPGSVDADTQQLLREIELLTDRALRETGRGIDS